MNIYEKPSIEFKQSPLWKVEYTLTERHGGWMHRYTMLTCHGAVDLWVNEMKTLEGWARSGGLETHYNSPPTYMKNHAPHHQECWLTKLPCWHDGTSLYVEENILPYWQPGKHDFIFNELRRHAKNQFGIEEEQDELD